MGWDLAMGEQIVTPHRLVLEGIYMVVVDIITGNAPGKGLYYMGIVGPHMYCIGERSMSHHGQ